MPARTTSISARSSPTRTTFSALGPIPGARRRGARSSRKSVRSNPNTCSWPTSRAKDRGWGSGTWSKSTASPHRIATGSMPCSRIRRVHGRRGCARSLISRRSTTSVTSTARSTCPRCRSSSCCPIASRASGSRRPAPPRLPGSPRSGWSSMSASVRRSSGRRTGETRRRGERSGSIRTPAPCSAASCGCHPPTGSRSRR